MSGLLNINVQEGATFSKALSFQKTVIVTQGTHPITKEPVVVYEKVPLDITGMRLVAQIRDNFNSPTFVQDITCTVLGGTAGRAAISLSKEQTSRLAQVATLQPTGVGCARTFKIGYYDLIAVDTLSNTSTKLFFGTVFMTLSATNDPAAEITPEQSVFRSNPAAKTVNILLPVDTLPIKYTIGVRYLSAGIPVLPTGGYVQVYRRAAVEGQQGVPTLVGSLDSTNPNMALSVGGSTSEFICVPFEITNADSYQLVAVGSLF